MTIKKTAGPQIYTLDKIGNRKLYIRVDDQTRLISFSNRFPKMEFTILSTIANKIALQNPSTRKPSITRSAKGIIKAFITRKNNPKVIKVMGSVRMINTGLKVRLINMMNAAKINPVKKSSI